MHAGTANPSNELELSKAKDLAPQLGAVGVRTLYRMAAQGLIPFYRVGRSGVRFNLDEVREALRCPGKSG